MCVCRVEGWGPVWVGRLEGLGPVCVRRIEGWGVCVCRVEGWGPVWVVGLRAGDQVRSLRDWFEGFDLTLWAIPESMSLKSGGTRVYEPGIRRDKSP